MHRRLFRRIAISLTLGAIVTVLVGWAVMFRDVDDAVSTWLVPGDWPIAVPSTWPAKPDDARWLKGATSSVLMTGSNRQAWTDSVRSAAPATWYRAGVVYFGWPFHGMRRDWMYTLSGVKLARVDLGILRQGLPLPASWTSALQGRIETLPIMPTWPGFRLNTLFYGLIIFLARTGDHALKRRRRVRRGLCSECAYPTSGLTICPECGTQLPKPRIT